MTAARRKRALAAFALLLAALLLMGADDSCFEEDEAEVEREVAQTTAPSPASTAAPTPTVQPVAVSATTLWEAYNANEVAADQLTCPRSLYQSLS